MSGFDTSAVPADFVLEHAVIDIERDELKLVGTVNGVPTTFVLTRYGAVIEGRG